MQTIKRCTKDSKFNNILSLHHFFQSNLSHKLFLYTVNKNIMYNQYNKEKF